ncbi:serine hydrolase domain-containing protein [Streptococcus massiliensis]|uniref:Beta-lactamase-like protein n=1 Tax=Streptococcus massiliensis TaxID=313439 RepID=A0A380L437_9STRE|nr:serine hydrolase domain-containing protein [Streptococcus massiliensis]SUN77271.1 beta-lactamase-like protein [Streptococcus massiliensis]
MTMNKKLIFDKISEQLAENLYPGASVSLYQVGDWQDSYFGLADPETGLASQAGLVYDLASVSKVVGVGTIFAFMAHKGELELDQTLKELYPTFDHEQVTLRQLLTHTSGLNPFIPNRDQLDQEQLKEALNHLQLKVDKSFHYTDVNFLLLGFLLEELYGQSLNVLFEREIFQPWQMRETSFGPLAQAVPTVRGARAGLVHDPKARVLGVHAGSAGLFSTVADLKKFLEHYLTDDFAQALTQNYSREAGKTRSLAWNLEGDWLDHTGYTGTFLMYNRKSQEAAIFLSNRTYERDERAYWIEKRNELMNLIRKS